MEWFTWTNLFWFIIMVQVFKAILDRITGYRAFEKRVYELEKALALMVDTHREISEGYDRVSTSHSHVTEMYSELVERVNTLSRQENERRHNARARRMGVRGISEEVDSTGGHWSNNGRYIPGRRLSDQEVIGFQVTSVRDDVATLDNGDISFHARHNGDGSFTIIDTSNSPPDTRPARPSAVPNGSGTRRINLEDE